MEEASDLLAFASRYGLLEAAQVAIQRGADLTFTKWNDYQPIHLAAAFGHTKIIKLLVENGVSPDAATSESSETPLHVAAACDALKSIRYLMSLEANIQAIDKYHMQPIHCAADAGATDSFNLLVSAGANKDTKILGGHSAIETLKRRNQEQRSSKMIR